MKYILSSLAFLFACSNLWAQSEFQIKGIIADESGTPLPYADIRAFYSSDSSFASGAMSEESGAFTFELKAGSYYFVIEYFEFKSKTVSGTVNNQPLELGTITLESVLNKLTEVEVVSQRPQMELKLDKRVYNVASDLNNQGTTASEMLENIPSVTVDAEGNVSLRGNQNVRILVDGKYSGFASTADALKQLQTDRIERVEIITNASSRYDAQGDAGIINIVMKKNQKDGFNGSINARLGYFPEYGAGFSFNYRKKKWNYFLSYNINQNNSPANSNTYQKLNSPDTSFIYRQLYEHDRNKFRNDATFGVDYDINDNNTIGANINFRSGIGSNSYDRVYENLDINDALLSRDTRIEDQTELEDLYEATLTYKRKLHKEGGEWNTELKFFRDQDYERSLYTDKSSSYEGEGYERSKAYVVEKFFLLQSDYIYPFGKEGKVEAGIRSQWRNMNNDFGFSEQVGIEWVSPTRFNDVFDYDEKVHAAYAMGSNTYGKFGIQAGLRAEYSDITTLQDSEGKPNNKNYINFFPSAALSYKLNDMTTAQLSYSKRIHRPGQWDLMPFMKFGDNREMRIGNVDINPEFTDVLEGGIMRYFTKGSLLSSLYYRRTVDKIERMAEIGSDGIIYRVPMNIASRDAAGLELNGNYNPANWLRFTTGFNFYYETIAGEYKGEQFERDNFSWSNRTSANISLPQKWRMQVSSNYEAPRVTAQGKTLAIFFADFGMSKDFWNNNATIGLNVRDIFNSRRWKNETNTEYLYSVSDFQWRPRSFRLTFTYRFNQTNKEQTRNGAGMESGGGMEGEG